MILWNREHAIQRLSEELERAQKEGNSKFSILLVQFDGLSRIADQVGYAFGDRMWRLVLRVLTEDLRPRDLCRRISGEEFLLILPARGEPECRDLAERIRQRWAPEAGTREATLEVGIGLASYPAHGSTTEALFAAADEAMHADKDLNH